MVEKIKNKKTDNKISTEVLVPKKTTQIKKSRIENTTKASNSEVDTKISKKELVKNADVKPFKKEVVKSADVRDSKKELVKNTDVKPSKKEVVKSADVRDSKKELVKNADVKPSKKEVIIDKTHVKKTEKKTSDKKSSFCTKITFIKNSFSDVSLMYSNFFHWNFSKVLVFFYSILLGAISVIPLIGLFFAYSYFSDVNVSMLLEGLYTGTLLNNFFGNAILIFIIFICYIFYSYGNLVLINIYNGYIDKKNLPYKNSEYFNIKKIVKYFNITIINFLILLVPVIIFALLIGILLLFSGGLTDVIKMVSESPLNYFSILSIVFLIICSVFFIYAYYRIIFSYFVFADKNYYDTKAGVLTYIKESFYKTRSIKTFFKFFTIIILFIIITIPVKIVSVALKNNVKLLTDYTLYEKLSKEKKDYVTSTDPYYYQSLELEFKGFTDVELTKKLNLNEIYVLLFSILSFLFINGLFMMIYTSFYRREL